MLVGLPIVSWLVLLTIIVVGIVWLVLFFVGHRAPFVVDVTPSGFERHAPRPDSWHERELQGMGFTHCGDFVCQRGGRSSFRILAYLSSDWTHWAMLRAAPDDRARVRSVEFCTEFEPEMRIVTASRVPPMLLPLPRWTFRVFRPGVHSPRLLLRRHLALCSGAEEGAPTPIRVRPGDFRRWYQDVCEAEADELALRGLAHAFAEDAYRLSARGALEALPVAAWGAVRHLAFFWVPVLGLGENARFRRFLKKRGGVAEGEEETGDRDERADADEGYY